MREALARWRPRARLPALNPKPGAHWPLPARRLRPPSLRVQMAVGSAVVALVAVLLVTVIAVASVATQFDNYQRTQLAGEASQIAGTLGHAVGFATGGTLGGFGGSESPPNLGPLRPRRVVATNLWVMDRSGHLLTAPTGPGDEQRIIQQDSATVTAALRAALGGHSSEDALPGAGVLPQLIERLYAATPVRLGGGSEGAIIGAVALTTAPREGAGAVFTYLTKVYTTLGWVALGVALLAALGATLYSRRLTRPLDRLTEATARMAGGDYAARVKSDATEEFQRLATSFNEMAAALERDVGEIHREEQLRRELVANVSHELATPLTAIQGFTEALLDGLVYDATAREETIRTIAREAARLRRLVDQLRQVALFEAGAQALTRTPMQLATLVEETLAVLAPEAERRAVSIRSELDGVLPLVFADGDRLTEILLNLLDNALHHTPPGGSVEVGATIEGAYVRVGVADSGPGIAPADRERIFERFFRADYARSSASGGSGLGLAIVRALVEAHGGTIRADERPGGGARFTFTLPIAGTSTQTLP